VTFFHYHTPVAQHASWAWSSPSLHPFPVHCISCYGYGYESNFHIGWKDFTTIHKRRRPSMKLLLPSCSKWISIRAKFLFCIPGTPYVKPNYLRRV